MDDDNRSDDEEQGKWQRERKSERARADVDRQRMATAPAQPARPTSAERTPPIPPLPLPPPTDLLRDDKTVANERQTFGRHCGDRDNKLFMTNKRCHK